jgi:electron-transferring-flavoprotein dehydrogenase
MELHGKYVLIGEGVRGSLAKQLIEKFNLSEGKEPAEIRHRHEGAVGGQAGKAQAGPGQHTFGWPLDTKTGGGSFLYHLEDNQVAVGFVVHLNYKNPHLFPYEEFQRFKTHPAIRESSKAASASPMARARSPKAATSRCRSCRSRAAC